METHNIIEVVEKLQQAKFTGAIVLLFADGALKQINVSRARGLEPVPMDSETKPSTPPAGNSPSGVRL